MARQENTGAHAIWAVVVLVLVALVVWLLVAGPMGNRGAGAGDGGGPNIEVNVPAPSVPQGQGSGQ
jgi:hypothetical protein